MANRLKDLSVLVLEDEIFVAMALGKMLWKEGAAQVQKALNVAEATRLIADQFFDVAILDVRLPDGDPYDIARQLSARGTKVIFHSGHAANEDILSDFPSSRFCQKPCNPETFVRTILELRA